MEDLSRNDKHGPRSTSSNRPTSSCVGDSRFSCNICLEPVSEEPVVTQCGHLYCWPCLYRWLEPGMLPEERESLAQVNHNNNHDGSNFAAFSVIPPDRTRKCCPVCKTSCTVDSVIPIYVRSDDDDKVESSPKPLKEHATADDDTSDPAEQGSLASPMDIPSHQNAGALNESENATLDIGDPTTTTGLRQRQLRSRSATSSSAATEVTSNVIPPRPTASSHLSSSSSQVRTEATTRPMESLAGSMTQHHQQHQAIAAMAGQPTPYHFYHPYPYRASLAHGLAMAIQEAFFSNQQQHHQQQQDFSGRGSASSSIPRLHRQQRGNRLDSSIDDDGNDEHERNTRNSNSVSSPQDSAIEFLSRLLLMLGSFVILCLLLF